MTKKQTPQDANEASIRAVASTAGLCFIDAPYLRKQKKWKAQRFSPLGLMLEEEHDQERDDMQNLLIAQPQFECQFQHGNSPVYAGSAANWLRLAFIKRPCPALALGLPRMALSGSLVFGQLPGVLAAEYSVALMAGSVLDPILFR